MSFAGVSKSFKLHTLNNVEHVDANADAEGAPARMRARPKEMSRLLNNFHSAVEDVVFTLKPKRTGKCIELLSYIDPSTAASSVGAQTEMNIDTKQSWIVDYRHAGDTDPGCSENYESTVSMKDIKVGLSLCESLGRDVCISVRGVGCPFFLTAEHVVSSAQAAEVKQ